MDGFSVVLKVHLHGGGNGVLFTHFWEIEMHDLATGQAIFIDPQFPIARELLQCW